MKLKPDKCVLVIIDVQTKLLAVMHDYPLLLENLKKFTEACNILNIPIILTEQYPAGLGPTHPEIAQLIPLVKAVEKMTFSCCLDENFMSALRQLNREQILVCGIEAHVCVYQTCRDLLEKKYEVHLLTDAIDSRRPENKQLAIQKLAQLGVHLSSVEMALFEMLRDAHNPAFKAISKIIK